MDVEFISSFWPWIYDIIWIKLINDIMWWTLTHSFVLRGSSTLECASSLGPMKHELLGSKDTFKGQLFTKTSACSLNNRGSEDRHHFKCFFHEWIPRGSVMRTFQKVIPLIRHVGLWKISFIYFEVLACQWFPDF